MSSKIVAAVPNSLLTQKSRSGSRSKSGKNSSLPATLASEQMHHSKSLAGNRGIIGTAGIRAGNTELNEHLSHLQI